MRFTPFRLALLQIYVANFSFVGRDPTKHLTLKDEIEAQSTALYSTARLWDDGIIMPSDTRDVLGLALSLDGLKKRKTVKEESGEDAFGVFRM